MLRIGLTGGIGAGKSTVARRLVELGAVLVDSDVLARKAVAAGSEGLAAVAREFGPEVIGPDGEMDRPAVGAIVFGDPDALARLNAIVHPRVRELSDELVAGAAVDAIVVQDIPLLVEGGMASSFPLVVVVGVDAELRVHRLVEARGMGEQDARARIAAQADDERRRAVADVWLDNSGSEQDTRERVDALWEQRLVPFEENMRAGRVAPGGPPVLVDPDPSWPEQARRVADRVAAAVGERGRGVEHIGSTAVPGLVAKDVLDLQLGVDSLDDADAVEDALAAAGFPRREGVVADNPKPDDPDPGRWRKRLHGSADPGRRVNLHVRPRSGPGWRYAVAMRDWLRADPAARDEYAALKREAERLYGADPDAARYVGHKEPWFDAVATRMVQWSA
ncbi:dephospho-CoA kinase [Pseudonocardia endophytica]|uniref:Dephospho-CoA kinase n=1 Tax=Pseudonocardia endophytica TaxID=401976 RepID=A0A4R1HTN9_PSEEN|nr:dephospho-CoA kinase [Pseudonocardia endophytica]TCK24751.1 dephospho-CoA kinase [Pseudonocardia endophytica]